MKKILLLLILFSLKGLAQTAPCGTPAPTVQQVRLANAIYLGSVRNIKQARSTADIMYFPLKFIIVRKSDGTGGTDYTTINQGLALFNNFYLPAGIQFYIAPNGLAEVKSDRLYDINTSEMSADMNQVMSTNAINIFLVNSGKDNFQSFAGQASFPSVSNMSNWLVIQSNLLTSNNVASHEMGHYFSLYHPHDNPTGGARELVNGSNCTTAADQVCDTPADPYDLVRDPKAPLSATCTYTYDTRDANGQLYNPLLGNVMAYWNCAPFTFTNGQYERMRTIGTAGRTYPGNQYTLNAPATDVTPPLLSGLTSNSESVNLTWQDRSDNETGFLIERSKSATDGFVTVYGVALNVTQWTDNNTISGITYYYRIKASNALTYSNIQSAKLDYCKPLQREIWSCTSSEGTIGLESFKIWTEGKTSLLLDSKGVCSQNGNAYSNFSATTPAIKLSLGGNFPFQVEAMRVQSGANKGTLYATRINIWIDLNQDQAFSEDERLYISNLKWNSTFTTISGDYPNPFLQNQFTIPANAKTGLTRMRVRLGTPVFTGANETPCEQIDGETEDYLVDIGQCQLSVNLVGSTVICGNASTVLTASVINGTSPYAYEWKKGNSVAGNSSQLTISTADTYTFKVVDSKGCSFNSSFNTTVSTLPDAIITAPAGGLNLLSNGAVFLTANTGSGLSYQWNLDGNALPGASSVSYQATQAGVYTVLISNNGCTKLSPAVTVTLITATEPIGSGTRLEVYPNPLSRESKISLTLEKPARATLYLTDINGRNLRTWPLKTQQTKHELFFDSSLLTPGIYLFKVDVNGQQIVKKVLKE